MSRRRNAASGQKGPRTVRELRKRWSSAAPVRRLVAFAHPVYRAKIVMLAHRRGAPLNAAGLARSLAVDGKTIARYLDPWWTCFGHRFLRVIDVPSDTSGASKAACEIWGTTLEGERWTQPVSIPMTGFRQDCYPADRCDPRSDPRPQSPKPRPGRELQLRRQRGRAWGALLLCEGASKRRQPRLVISHLGDESLAPGQSANKPAVLDLESPVDLEKLANTAGYLEFDPIDS